MVPDSDPADQVSCLKCGFCCRHPDAHEGYLEIINANRASGYIGNPVALMCMKNKFDLNAELSTVLPNNDPINEKVKRVLELRRTCSEFTQYFPGYGPKEHDQFLREAQRKKEAADSLQDQKAFNQSLLDRQLQASAEQNEKTRQVAIAVGILAAVSTLLPMVVAWFKSDDKPLKIEILDSVKSAAPELQPKSDRVHSK